MSKPLPPIILASQSQARKSLLNRLNISFGCQPADIDETPITGESPTETVLRLSINKAKKVALEHPDALIIGSDELPFLGNTPLTKPLDHPTALAQLKQMSGQTISFYTGVCVYNSQTQHLQQDCVVTQAVFRELSEKTIERYCQYDQPYQCAGSFKFESLGITLIEKFIGDDPNALIGLPLIRLAEMLRQEGVNIP